MYFVNLNSDFETFHSVAGRTLPAPLSVGKNRGPWTIRRARVPHDDNPSVQNAGAYIFFKLAMNSVRNAAMFRKEDESCRANGLRHSSYRAPFKLIESIAWALHEPEYLVVPGTRRADATSNSIYIRVYMDRHRCIQSGTQVLLSREASVAAPARDGTHVFPWVHSDFSGTAIDGVRRDGPDSDDRWASERIEGCREGGSRFSLFFWDGRSVELQKLSSSWREEEVVCVYSTRAGFENYLISLDTAQCSGYPRSESRVVAALGWKAEWVYIYFEELVRNLEEEPEEETEGRSGGPNGPGPLKSQELRAYTRERMRLVAVVVLIKNVRSEERLTMKRMSASLQAKCRSTTLSELKTKAKAERASERNVFALRKKNLAFRGKLAHRRLKSVIVQQQHDRTYGDPESKEKRTRQRGKGEGDRAECPSGRERKEQEERGGGGGRTAETLFDVKVWWFAFRAGPLPGWVGWISLREVFRGLEGVL
ncbi:hypothetical protein SCHPADRAFT_887868 [Schizopora paradoxa]|uniref:Uncharacterized protein n=1 Tax=Schizopora paradoxa TaxID=27342 RepID=A0A0H2RXT9_9AGAM|nr:hypothetical protein SCHPADRAFT_887868 [Schizopora paradoxa]